MKCKNIELTQGKVATVDEQDFEHLSQWKWSAVKKGKKYYAVRQEGARGNQKNIYMHRQIMNAGAAELVDHADRDTLNNTRSNLRFCNWQQNAANSTSPGNKCGYRGVSIDRKLNGKPFLASIQVNGRSRHLGCFATAEEAAAAYDTAALKQWGEFAVLNGGDNSRKVAKYLADSMSCSKIKELGGR